MSESKNNGLGVTLSILALWPIYIFILGFYLAMKCLGDKEHGWALLAFALLVIPPLVYIANLIEGKTNHEARMKELEKGEKEDDAS
jgi:hypothetical protein